MQTLISLLGKSQLDSKLGYRSARYRFADGSERETAYFGLALAEQLKVDRLILVGTPSSMWDLLVENIVGDAAQEELRIELFDAVRTGSVTEVLLRRLEPALAEHIGRPVRALLTPFASLPSDQQALLAALADAMARGEHAVLDLTHGFRHLAMLGLTAARYLAHTRDVVVDALYYGALDMTEDGLTPVVELSGLAHVQEWAEALAAYEASGDFSRFAPLLQRDGLAAEQARALERGWDYLSVGNVNDAARQLQAAYQSLGTPLQGASELFRERLRHALRWVAAATLAERQRLLALQALQRGDLLRATLLGYEAFVSREVQAAGKNPLNFADKEAIEQQFRIELKDGEHADWKRHAFWLLKNLRNALAHHTVPTVQAHAQLLHNPSRLRGELEKTLNRLTNPALSKTKAQPAEPAPPADMAGPLQRELEAKLGRTSPDATAGDKLVDSHPNIKPDKVEQ